VEVKGKTIILWSREEKRTCPCFRKKEKGKTRGKEAQFLGRGKGNIPLSSKGRYGVTFFSKKGIPILGGKKREGGPLCRKKGGRREAYPLREEKEKRGNHNPLFPEKKKEKRREIIT